MNSLETVIPAKAGTVEGLAKLRGKRLKRLAKLITGWAFVVFGIIGLVLPILQGFLFLAIGLSILSTESPWAQRLLERVRNRHPELAATFDRAKERAACWLRRFNNTSGRKP